jgi:hypothetical protein
VPANTVTKILEIASKISNDYSLTSFAIAFVGVAIILLVRRRGTRLNAMVWLLPVSLAVLAALPLIARSYIGTHGIYRVRVLVLDAHHSPIEDCTVTSSLGGEPKKVAGGWEFDIPAATRPAGGRLTVYVGEPSAFRAGHADVTLDNDLNPTVTVELTPQESSELGGIILTRSGYPVARATVGVIGYESEAIVTGQDGNFRLSAHATEGQQAELYVRRPGHPIVTQWCQAGDRSVKIIVQ